MDTILPVNLARITRECFEHNKLLNISHAAHRAMRNIRNDQTFTVLYKLQCAALYDGINCQVDARGKKDEFSDFPANSSHTDCCEIVQKTPRGVQHVRNKFTRVFYALFTSCLEAAHTATNDGCTCLVLSIHEAVNTSVNLSCSKSH